MIKLTPAYNGGGPHCTISRTILATSCDWSLSPAKTSAASSLGIVSLEASHPPGWSPLSQMERLSLSLSVVVAAAVLFF